MQHIHLWIKEASWWLDNADSLIVGLDLIDVPLAIRNNRDKLQSQILRLHVRCEGVWQALPCAGWDLRSILDSRQVPDDGSRGMNACWEILQGRKRAPNDRDGDWLGLIVRDIDDGLCRVSIDQLDAEDLCRWEDGGDRDGEVWSRSSFFRDSFCGLVKWSVYSSLCPLRKVKGRYGQIAKLRSGGRQLTYGLRGDGANCAQSNECEGGEAIGNHGEDERMAIRMKMKMSWEAQVVSRRQP